MDGDDFGMLSCGCAKVTRVLPRLNISLTPLANVLAHGKFELGQETVREFIATCPTKFRTVVGCL